MREAARLRLVSIPHHLVARSPPGVQRCSANLGSGPLRPLASDDASGAPVAKTVSGTEISKPDLSSMLNRYSPNGSAVAGASARNRCISGAGMVLSSMNVTARLCNTKVGSAKLIAPEHEDLSAHETLETERLLKSQGGPDTSRHSGHESS